MRSEADYDDFKSFTLQEVTEAKDAVRALIDEVSAYLNAIS